MAIGDKKAHNIGGIVCSKMIMNGVSYDGSSNQIAALSRHDKGLSIRDIMSRDRLTAGFVLLYLERMECVAAKMDNAI